MRWFQMLLLLFSCPVMSNSLWPHGLQHTRPPCPSPSPRVCPSSCSLHRWYPIHLIFWHPLLLPSIFPSIRDFSSELAVCIRWPKYWSFSFSISPSMSIQGWFPLRLTGLISYLSKGPSGIFSSITVQRNQLFGILPSLRPSSHNCTWPLGRP